MSIRRVKRKIDISTGSSALSCICVRRVELEITTSSSKGERDTDTHSVVSLDLVVDAIDRTVFGFLVRRAVSRPISASGWLHPSVPSIN